MKNGKTRTQRVKVLANGKYKFVKNSGSRSTKTTKKVTKRRTKRVPRRRAKRRRRIKSKKIPILPLAGLGVALAKPIENALAGDYKGALAELGARFTGYNYQSQVFDPKYALMNGYLPVVAGSIGSKVATKLGVNRALGKIPMIGKYIKL